MKKCPPTRYYILFPCREKVIRDMVMVYYSTAAVNNNYYSPKTINKLLPPNRYKWPQGKTAVFNTVYTAHIVNAVIDQEINIL